MAQPLSVAHRAPHDLPEHVAAPLVRRHHAVGDQEGHRPHVVGDDAHRHVRRLHRAAVGGAGARADGREQRREHVGVVVRELTLQDRRHALEAHAGVDRGGRQRVERAIGLPIEFHEHVVPDFDVAVAVALEAAAASGPRLLRRRGDPARGRNRSRSSVRRGRCRPSTRSCRPRRARRSAPLAGTSARSRAPRHRAGPPHRRGRSWRTAGRAAASIPRSAASRQKGCASRLK